MQTFERAGRRAVDFVLPHFNAARRLRVVGDDHDRSSRSAGERQCSEANASNVAVYMRLFVLLTASMRTRQRQVSDD